MLSNIDMIIVLSYLSIMLFIGYLSRKGNKNQEDYFLAGRSMPWIPVAISVAATMLSANGFVGGPGWAYGSGISPFMVNIAVPLAIMFALYTFIPVFYHLKITSVYEYSQKRLGPFTRMVTVFGFLLNSLIQVSSMVYIPALIVSTFTDFNIELSVVAIVIIAIIYTILGGIRAVIWTDTTQMIVLWGGMFFSFIYISDSIGLSFTESYNTIKESGKLTALDFSSDITKTNGFYASLIGGFIMWLRYFGLDQAQVQRILTSKSYRGVKKSFVISAIIMNTVYFIFMVLGVMLFLYYDGHEFKASNDVIIDFIGNHLPVGVVGILIASIFAAAMSSIDSLLNSMTTVYTKDIHEPFFSKNHELASVKSTMIISFILGIIIVIFTLIGFSGTLKSVLDVIGGYISYISGPMCGAFTLAMFTLRASDKGVALGMILGGIITFIISKNFIYSWIWNPFLGFFFTTIIGYIISIFLPCKKSADEIYKYTVMGQRRIIKEKGLCVDEKVSTLPLSIDRYSIILIVFFLAQYVFLYFIG